MNIQTLLEGFISLLQNTVLPVIMTIAVLFFLVNVIRYFIVGGGSEESQQSARRLAVWGIMAFVIIGALWGFVAVVNNVFDLDRVRSVVPDYECEQRKKTNPNIDCVREQRILDDTSGAGDGGLGDIPFTS